MRSMWVAIALTSGMTGCGGDKAAEKTNAVPDPGAVDAPQPAAKAGLDAAPGAPASRSGAPPWLVDAPQGQGACRDADGALDCSGVSGRVNRREDGERQALDVALRAMSDRIMPGAGDVVRAEIDKVRPPTPDDVWWEELPSGTDRPDVVVYVRARLSAEQRAAVTSALGAVK